MDINTLVRAEEKFIIVAKIHGYSKTMLGEVNLVTEIKKSLNLDNVDVIDGKSLKEAFTTERPTAAQPKVDDGQMIFIGLVPEGHGDLDKYCNVNTSLERAAFHVRGFTLSYSPVSGQKSPMRIELEMKGKLKVHAPGVALTDHLYSAMKDSKKKFKVQLEPVGSIDRVIGYQKFDRHWIFPREALMVEIKDPIPDNE